MAVLSEEMSPLRIKRRDGVHQVKMHGRAERAEGTVDSKYPERTQKSDV